MLRSGDAVYAIIKEKNMSEPTVVSAVVLLANDDEIIIEHKVSKCSAIHYRFAACEWKHFIFYQREAAEAMLYEQIGEHWRADHGLAHPVKRKGAALYRKANEQQLSVQELCVRIKDLVCLADIDEREPIIYACPDVLAYSMYAECRVDEITACDKTIVLWLKKFENRGCPSENALKEDQGCSRKS